MDLENKLSEIHNYEEIIDIHDNPVVKLLIDITKSIPGWGSIISFGDNLATKLLAKSYAKKFKIVIDEILNSDKEITIDMLDNINNIESFRQMMMLVDKTNSNEKILLFARLYKNSCISKDKIINDEYEEYLQLLNELSFREIDILIIYDKYLGIIADFKGSIDDNEQFKSFIKEITTKYNLTRNQVIDIIKRLSYKGLCFYDSASYDTSINGKISFTTEYFKKFAKRISGK